MLKNAIVVMFDSLQFNYLGCYGNTWIKTPNFDRLAREGVLFENAYPEGLPTVPCRRAMHTGRFTLPVSGWVGLSSKDTTIADLCWGRPIDTALIFDCPMYRLPKFGYTRGFDKVWFTHGHEADDYFYEQDELIHLNIKDYIEESSYRAVVERSGAKMPEATLGEIRNYLKQRQYGGDREENRYVARTMRKAVEYLEGVDRNKQFYLWVDSFDPHEPWDPPSVYDPDKKCPYDPDYQGKDEFLPFPGLVAGVYTEEQLHHVRMLYAELVTLCDKYLGELLDAVRRLGLEENTLLLMVSDHGEPMGNGEHGHGLMRKVRPWPYEELAHIPMILRAPGIAPGQRVSSFVQSVDVAPTVCDWLGIGVHPDMQGKSLLPLARGEVDKVRDFAIAGYYPYSQAIFTENWSYIHWTRNDDKAERLMALEFYGGNIDNSHIHATGGKGMFEGQFEALEKRRKEMKAAAGEEGLSDIEKRHKANATLDGADQWTCTPSSSSEVPDRDLLFDRRADPFQLHNVADQHPDQARKLYALLNDYLDDLRA